MKYQTMPPLSEADEIALEKSIRTFGIQVPIIVDENGDVIDGHHRKAIAQRIGAEIPVERRRHLTEDEKVALSISLNIDRRQLSREQKREIIAASIKATPAASNREHARRVGADDKTVGAVRTELEQRAEIPHVSERTDSVGRQQPASKPSPVVSITSRKSESVTETFDAETGEQIEDALPSWFPPEVEQKAQEKAAALRSFVDDDPALQNKVYIANFSSEVSKARGFLGFDPTRIGQIADDMVVTTIEHLAEDAQRFFERCSQSAHRIAPDQWRQEMKRKNTRIDATWPDRERAEHDVLLESIIDQHDNSANRADALTEALDSGPAATKLWARDVDRKLRYEGARKYVQDFANKIRPTRAITSNGKVHHLPGEIGVRRRSDDGTVDTARKLWDFATWDEIRNDIVWAIQMKGSFDARAALGMKLLKLQELGGGENPHEAALVIGTTVEDWLERAA
jgi:hypothetical protein